MCARPPHLLLLVFVLALALAGCPGELEAPDRFGDLDAAAGGSSSGGGGSSGGSSGGGGASGGADAGGDG